MDAAFQGGYGESYVASIAHDAGLQVSSLPSPDRSGIDLVVQSIYDDGRLRAPSVEIQVKTWSRPTGTAGNWRFDGLTERQFNRLAGTGFYVPRLLVVVIVPTNVIYFTEIQTNGLLLRDRAYYVSLEDESVIESPSRDRRRAVRIPRDNILDAAALSALVHAEFRSVRAAS